MLFGPSSERFFMYSSEPVHCKNVTFSTTNYAAPAEFPLVRYGEKS